LKDISWGHGLQVTTMSKYVVNGYKFHTEDCSKNKNSNNSGVWVQGGDGNQVGDIDYYGVVKEILQLEYTGWPYKKLILFRCKWFDPNPTRGTRVHNQYNIIEVNHTREYDRYDPFIIAHNVRQVYYAPYPLRRNKSDWWVVIKTKPVGRVEVENVLDVAYQNDISNVHQIVDDQLENDLEHPECILEEVDINEVTIIENEDEESTDEAQTSEDEEFSDEEQYVDED